MVTPMKVVTWNVNSIRARHDRVLAFLDRESPDVLCLQETKVADDVFPHEAIAAAGYHAVVHGQATYNGVAIVSRTEASDVVTGLGAPDGEHALDGQARLIAATVEGVRVVNAYVPNGGEIGSDKWTFKLAWMAAMERYLRSACDTGSDLVFVGDFNCAPRDLDVANPDRWRETVLCADKVRELMRAWEATGLTDVVRSLHPDTSMYSWWDYRRLAFPKGDGLRIDHILASASSAERCTAARIDRDERKGKGASDHAPVIAQFA